MTDDVDTRPEVARSSALALASAFVALLALTAGELTVIGLAVGRAARITALAGLLMAKVGLVLSFFMGARARRQAPWLTLVAIGFAAGVAVVLMLETIYRVRVQ